MVKDGIKKLADIKSSDFEMAITAALKSPKDQKLANFNFTLSGDSDGTNQLEPKVNMHLDVSADAEGQNGSGAAEFRMNKDAIYFSLAKLAMKDEKGANAVPPMLVGYIGKWWKIPIPEGALKQLMERASASGTSQESFTEQQAKMKAIFENTQFIKNVQLKGVDNVKGEQSYHYTGDIDKDAVEKVIYEAGASSLTGVPAPTAEEKQKFHDALAKLNFTGEVWVGKDSGILNQMSGSVLLPASDTDPSGTVSFRMTFSNFNKTVNVVAPADAEEFPLKGLFGSMLGASDPSLMDGSGIGDSSMMGSGFAPSADAMIGLPQ